MTDIMRVEYSESTHQFHLTFNGEKGLPYRGDFAGWVRIVEKVEYYDFTLFERYIGTSRKYHKKKYTLKQIQEAYKLFAPFSRVEKRAILKEAKLKKH